MELGYSAHAFMTIITQHTNHQPSLSFIKTQDQYIIHNYKISGDGCYLLECRFKTFPVIESTF